MSGSEQMSVLVRYVVDDMVGVSVVYKMFLGFIRLEEFDSKSLAEKLANFLKSLGVNLTLESHHLKLQEMCLNEHLASHLNVYH